MYSILTLALLCLAFVCYLLVGWAVLNKYAHHHIVGLRPGSNRDPDPEMKESLWPEIKIIFTWPILCGRLSYHWSMAHLPRVYAAMFILILALTMNLAKLLYIEALLIPYVILLILGWYYIIGLLIYALTFDTTESEEGFFSDATLFAFFQRIWWVTTWPRQLCQGGEAFRRFTQRMH